MFADFIIDFMADISAYFIGKHINFVNSIFHNKMPRSTLAVPFHVPIINREEEKDFYDTSSSKSLCILLETARWWCYQRQRSNKKLPQPSPWTSEAKTKNPRRRQQTEEGEKNSSPSADKIYFYVHVLCWRLYTRSQIVCMTVEWNPVAGESTSTWVKGPRIICVRHMPRKRCKPKALLWKGKLRRVENGVCFIHGHCEVSDLWHSLCWACSLYSEFCTEIMNLFF